MTEAAVQQGRAMAARVERTVAGESFLRFAATGIVIVGILIRIRQYLVGRSLWVDEAMLVHNVLTRDFAGFLRPLDTNQAAPVLFLWAEKLATIMGGTSEFALRFVPLLSGILALILFLPLARRLLSPFAATLAVLLFTFSRQMFWYANETKQYSGDVLISVLALWFFILYRDGRHGVWRWAAAIALGVAASFFSHPAIIMLGSAALIGFIFAWRDGRSEQRAGFFAAGLVWGVVFILNYSLFMNSLVTSDFLTSYWAPQGFMPPLSQGMGVLVWLGQTARSLFYDTLGLGLDPLAIFAGLAGLIVTHRRDRSLALMLLLPVVVTLVAACLRLYPFDDRLILFLAPVTAFVVGAGIEEVFNLLRPRMALLAWALVLLIIGQPLLIATYTLVLPRYREELAPVLAQMRASQQAGDGVYVYYGAQPAYDYYAPRLGLDPADAVRGNSGRDDWQVYYDDLDQLIAGQDRTWLVFSHIYGIGGVLDESVFNESTVFLAYLEKMGYTPEEQVDAFGAVAYLFDFGPGG